MAKGLREQLIGAWKLVSFEERPIDGSPSTYPLTEQPMGIILYTPDGYMSAQLSEPNRRPFASGDWFSGTPEEYAQEGSTYVAYTGEFHVNEEEQTLTHSMFISLYPNWIGQTQPRVVRIEDNDLYLSIENPLLSNGRLANCYLHWKRAEAN